MPFHEKDKRALLIKSGRRCSLCWKYCGTKIEVAHIIPEVEGGSDDEDNGIPLCFDCHAEVGHYNPNHPRGNKFSPKELKEHRERLFQYVAKDGPIVFDAIEKQVITIPSAIWEQQENPINFNQVNLEHEAKVARYRKYIVEADKLKQLFNFKDAIKFYESAFLLAESDVSLDDYASGGNYYYKKILLWQCYLEVSERDGSHESLRNAFNMGMDENEIIKMFQRQDTHPFLTCDHYFYLLLQEKLFLFDEEYRNRIPVDQRLQRVKHLMDLIEDPCCLKKEEQLLQKAKAIERQIQDKLPSYSK